MKYTPSRKKAKVIIEAYELCQAGTRFWACRDCKARGEVQYMRLPCKYCYRRAKAILGGDK